MKKYTALWFVGPILVIAILSLLSLPAKSQVHVQSFSQSYFCDGYAMGQRVSVYDMQNPIIGYIEIFDQWYTFERGEVFLDHDVPAYFTWDGVEWTFNYLPDLGNLIETPYDYENWARLQVGYFEGENISLLELFNQAHQAPNCWRR